MLSHYLFGHTPREEDLGEGYRVVLTKGGLQKIGVVHLPCRRQKPTPFNTVAASGLQSSEKKRFIAGYLTAKEVVFVSDQYVQIANIVRNLFERRALWSPPLSHLI